MAALWHFYVKIPHSFKFQIEDGELILMEKMPTLKYKTENSSTTRITYFSYDKINWMTLVKNTSYSKQVMQKILFFSCLFGPFRIEMLYILYVASQSS